jgi:hypothetical protein
MSQATSPERNMSSTEGFPPNNYRGVTRQGKGTRFRLHKRTFAQRSQEGLKPQHFELQKGIALGFWLAIGFRNKPKRTIFDVWCSDPLLEYKVAGKFDRTTGCVRVQQRRIPY